MSKHIARDAAQLIAAKLPGYRLGDIVADNIYYAEMVPVDGNGPTLILQHPISDRNRPIEISVKSVTGTHEGKLVCRPIAERERAFINVLTVATPKDTARKITSKLMPLAIEQYEKDIAWFVERGKRASGFQSFLEEVQDICRPTGHEVKKGNNCHTIKLADQNQIVLTDTTATVNLTGLSQEHAKKVIAALVAIQF